MRNYFRNLTIERAMGMERDPTPMNKDKAAKLLSKVIYTGEENKYEAVLDFFQGPRAVEFRLGNKGKPLY